VVLLILVLPNRGRSIGERPFNRFESGEAAFRLCIAFVTKDDRQCPVGMTNFDFGMGERGARLLVSGKILGGEYAKRTDHGDRVGGWSVAAG
jgi:hypothetical protein